MNRKTVVPYGSWQSPITTDLFLSESVGLSQIAIDGDDIYWVETRTDEGGRNVIVRRTVDGRERDVNPTPFDVRTRVHEYGGRAYLVSDGTVYFSNLSDQRLYRQEYDGQPEPVTSVSAVRYADGDIDYFRNRIVCVREDHTQQNGEPVNTLVSVHLEDAGIGEIIVDGSDFYSSPRVSPDGARLAWISWDHPNMPWDASNLWVANIRPDGSIIEHELIAGGSKESIFQPEWSPNGILYFVSDRSGWWNLYRWDQGRVEPVYTATAEFGKPHWVFGSPTYAFESAERIICSYCVRGKWSLGIIKTSTGELTEYAGSFDDMSRGEVRSTRGRVLFIAGSPLQPFSLYQLDPDTGRLDTLRKSNDVRVHREYLSEPRNLEFPTEQGCTAYGFFYAPKNKDYLGPSDQKPPLLVLSHGGPTATATTSLDFAVQYWTSRGIAVLDVNYGGSTGYGRDYRRRLLGEWGVVDVNDCENGARYLVDQGEVDGEQLAIKGSSAGGYTTLAALTFRNVFKAGASYYGVSDLESLAKDTHKFEARYLESLIGPYPLRRDLYLERSPIHHTQMLSCPVVLFHGLQDKIVPPNQAEMMLEALRCKGIPVAYIPFLEEQHGFKKASNIKRALEGELYFYSRIFGFELADEVEPLLIENL